MPPAPATDLPQTPPAHSALIRVFGRIGLLSFGGPAAQIALMQRELVEQRDWLTQRQYLDALSFCMLLPGPEAMQLATYAGWKLRGVPGGLIAGGLFVLPGALVVLALSFAYAAYGAVPLVAALFLGVQATIIIIVLEALFKLSRRALGTTGHRLIAAAAFIGIYVFQLPFPLIIAAAALAGFASVRTGAAPHAPGTAPPPLAGMLPTVALWLALWLAPVAVLWAIEAPLLTDLALFFGQLAVVTFGGAYAVLAWMTQVVVQDYGWLTTAQMIDGLGLAETTPGPLILVTQFVGFLAGYQAGGAGLALAAAGITLWMTFVPCFLWIFAGAPYVAWLGEQPRLSAGLRAISAAVVGVIANLSLWFALHVVFAQTGMVTGPFWAFVWPDPASLRPLALALTGAAGALIWGLRWPVVPVLIAMAALSAGAAALA
ncbi:chromate efflux transporter [Roseicitreum antarcticum]|uniref:Chromate transporter n=1 Tax=Roseicitreum antarcticum TaxID=564137 RepID=A0A1H2ZV75_9RHOB|nr:chromate efflux transporter [Roseicitreum antarcticum]SDX21161.1 chromate transporter [Roseicitreum antarcticum]